jgi:transcriptional regulator GlxA family with amidase domain
MEARVRIAILIPPNAHPLEAAGLSEVFDEANRSVSGPPAYQLLHVALEATPVRSSSGLILVPDHSIAEAVPPIDTLVIAAAYGIPAPAPPLLLGWVQEVAAQARRFGAVCTGAFLLGEAGLLEGRQVTTHWQYASELARRFPNAMVDPDRIYIRDGALFTSAGVSAALDLALSLVEEDLGRDLALAVARQLVMFLKRPGGQSQYSVHLATQTAERGPVQRVQQWVHDNPQEEHSLATLAQQAGTSERNLSRIFRQATGMAVREFVEAVRLDVARRLLEETGLPLKRIALDSGFGTTEVLRAAFIRRLGVGPLDYRARFQSATKSVQ